MFLPVLLAIHSILRLLLCALCFRVYMHIKPGYSWFERSCLVLSAFVIDEPDEYMCAKGSLSFPGESLGSFGCHTYGGRLVDDAHCMALSPLGDGDCRCGAIKASSKPLTATNALRVSRNSSLKPRKVSPVIYSRISDVP